MKVLVLYHPNSEQAGQVSDYARDYKRTRGRELELISLETKKGADLAKLYDATSYPTVLALEADGRLLHMWQAPPLPLMNDIDSYYRA